MGSRSDLATAQLVRLDAYASTDEAATFAASQRADGRGGGNRSQVDRRCQRMGSGTATERRRARVCIRRADLDA